MTNQNKKSVFVSVSDFIQANSFPILIVIISWFGLYLLAYFSIPLFPLRESPQVWQAYPDNIFLDGWARWDSSWYHKIALTGYSNTTGTSHGQLDTAYFPFYPWLIALFMKVIPDPYLCGLLISNICFLFAIIVLYKLLQNYYETEFSKKLIILFSLYPFSLFYRAMYTESLFLFAVVSAFYFGEKKKWIPASVFAAVAGGTRVIGFITVIALLILYLEQIDFDWKKVRLNILYLLIGITGPASYMIYLTYHFGNPFAFLAAQYVPGREGSSPFQYIVTNFDAFLSAKYMTTRFYPALMLFYFVLFIIVLILCLYSWRRPRICYSVWATLTLIASFARIESMGRYTSVLFPAFIVLTLTLKNNSFYRIFLYLSILMLCAFTILFNHFYWVA